MAFIAYNNRVTRSSTLTDDGGTLNNMSNVVTPQVPAPYASFSGDTAEMTATFSGEVQLLALLGHNLPDGTSVTWKQPDGTTITTATVAQFKNRPPNLYTLISAQTLSGVRVAISGAGSGDHRIAGLWASPVREFGALAGTRWQPRSDTRVSSIAGTDWVSPGIRRRGIPMQAIGSREDMLGVSRDGTESSADDWETILYQIEESGGWAIVTPSHQPQGTTDQTTIDALAIYGRVQPKGAPEQIEGDRFRVRFNVVESR